MWESVAEATEMEQLRLELELDRQSNGGRLMQLSNRFSRVESQRDSGLPDIDHSSPSLPPSTINCNYSGILSGVSVQNLYSSSPSSNSLRNGNITNGFTSNSNTPTKPTTNPTSFFEEGAVHERLETIDGALYGNKSMGKPLTNNPERISYNSMDSGMLDVSV